MRYISSKTKVILAIASVAISVSPFFLSAETVSGGGYSVEQIIAPIQGALTGNGFVVEQSSQSNAGKIDGGGFSVFSIFGTSTFITPPPPPPTNSGGTHGGGFYVLPPEVTGQVVSTSSPTSTSTKPLPPGTILTGNGSTCSTRVTFSAPIDVGSAANKSEDVKKLERFLNEYEGEKLPVNGIYEKRDIDAVKRWQVKYRSFVLDPMRLKQPTGTVYTLSMRQIERQTTRYCGEPVVVTACPFFRTNTSYGDRGAQVKKVQQFLNIVQGERLPLSGVFGPLTRNAVKRFQKSRKIYVSTYIPISIATGNWYTTTRIKANETIGCDILK